ncbi:MAG: FecR domain-containing protein [Acidobacteria bacterium]|nr:FecR domain-containing protein [Acidobacteriota bacterium]MCB9397156.1 FecR domain-containing protein [Acidobacteriota bacterium]
MNTLFLILFAFVPAAYDDEFIDAYEQDNFSPGYEVARVTYSEPGIELFRDGEQAEELIRNFPIGPGDLIKTEYRGYAEIAFVDGTLLQLDLKTELEFQAVYEVFNEEALTVLKLHRGSLFLHLADMPEPLKGRVYRVDTQSGSAYFEAPGTYRVDFEVNRMTVKTFRGVAELSGSADSVLIRSGEYATINNRVRPYWSRSFNSFSNDRFERWAYRRTPNFKSVSRSYLDSSIAFYASDLDDNGDWYYEDGIGTHVWVPRISNGWRPYYDGYWTRCGTVLTWVSRDPFGWVTHHYGRWGWSDRWGWYWIPGRTYSPAWVAWTSYDNYIGWCPLGYYDRPYYYGRGGVNISVNINIGNSWTYVSCDRFSNRHVRTYYENVKPRGRRVVTTRPIHVTRTEFGKPQEIVRVVRDPQVNRTRATAVARRTPILVERSTSGNDVVSRGEIYNRNSGTRNESRVRVDVPRESPASRDEFTNSRSGSSSATRSRDSSTSERSVERTQPSSRGEVRQRSDSANRTSSSPERNTRSNTTSSRESNNRTESTRRYPSDQGSDRKETPNRNTGNDRQSTERQQPPARATNPYQPSERDRNTRSDSGTRTESSTRSQGNTRSESTRSQSSSRNDSATRATPPPSRSSNRSESNTRSSSRESNSSQSTRQAKPKPAPRNPEKKDYPERKKD